MAAIALNIPEIERRIEGKKPLKIEKNVEINKNQPEIINNEEDIVRSYFTDKESQNCSSFHLSQRPFLRNV